MDDDCVIDLRGINKSYSLEARPFRALIIDPGIGLQSQAPRAQQRCLRTINRAQHLLARSFRYVDPQVQRRTFEQCRPFILPDQRRH